MLNKIYSKVDLPPSMHQLANNGRILTIESMRRRSTDSTTIASAPAVAAAKLSLPPLAPGLRLAAAGSLDWGAPMAHIKKMRKGGVQVLVWLPFCQYTQQPNKVQLRRGEGRW